MLQKFVRRGWVCKTQEGEIALYYGGGQYMGAGISPQLWDFSVRDKSVAADLNKAVGHRVQLHYTEHPGIPTSCFAETRYLVDQVTITDNEPGSVTRCGSSPPAPAGCTRLARRFGDSDRSLGELAARGCHLLGDAHRGAQRQQSILAAHRRRRRRSPPNARNASISSFSASPCS